jgi:hypothetical protein
MSNDSIERTLGRLEAKVDALLDHHETTVKRLDSHSRDIRGLQLWRAGLAGAYALLVMIVGTFFKFNK